MGSSTSKAKSKYSNQSTQDYTDLNDLFDTKTNSIVYCPKSVLGKAGKNTTIPFRNQVASVFYDNADTHFKENLLSYSTDQVVLRQATIPYIFGEKGQSIEQQSVAIDLAADAKEAIATGMGTVFSLDFFSQLTGTALSDPSVPNFSPTGAVSKCTNTLTGTASLATIVQAMAMAKQLKFIRTTTEASGAKFVLYMNPAEEATLRAGKDSSSIAYADVLMAQAVSKKDSKPLTADVMGTVMGVELRSSIWCPAGKMYLLGGQAIGMVKGEGYEDRLIRIGLESWDFGNRPRAGGTSVYGMKKLVNNGKDFGVIEITVGSSSGK